MCPCSILRFGSYVLKNLTWWCRFMFTFGYGRGHRPPPFNFRRHRPQKPQSSGETFAARVAREAREREEQAEARERKWQQQQEKKVRILVDDVREG